MQSWPASFSSASIARRAARPILLITALATLLTIEPQAGSTPQAAEAAETAMQKFLSRPPATHQYRASRRLEATGSGQRAWMDARTDFSPAEGLRYEVTAEGGSGIIRSRVLRSLLDEEQRLASDGGSRVALSTENYRFTSAGLDDDGLAIVTMKPLRKDRALIDGRLVLTDEGDLVRVEGRLVKNPSFWLTRVMLVRSYRRLNGVLVPVSLQSTAQMRLLGRSTLHMTYRYSEVDDRLVEEDLPPEPAGDVVRR